LLPPITFNPPAPQPPHSGTTNGSTPQTPQPTPTPAPPPHNPLPPVTIADPWNPKPPPTPTPKPGPTGTVNGGTCNTIGGKTTCTDPSGHSCTTTAGFCDPGAPPKPLPPPTVAANPKPLPPPKVAPTPKPLPPPEVAAIPPPAPPPQHQANLPPPPPEPVVQPACHKGQAVFHTDRSDSITVPETSIGGGECVNSFVAQSPASFTSASIAGNPSNGKLDQTGHYEFKYQPRAGFKGADKYTIQICGKGPTGSGCSRLTYQVSVE
jgi:hypothetical protein